MNVDAFGDATPLPAFGPRMVCTVLRDHWRIRPAQLAGARKAENADRRTVTLTAKRSRSLSARPPTCWRSGPSCAAPSIPDNAKTPSRKRLFPVGNLANARMSRGVVIRIRFLISPFATIGWALHRRRIVFGDDGSYAIDLIAFGHNRSPSRECWGRSPIFLHPPTHRWGVGAASPAAQSSRSAISQRADLPASPLAGSTWRAAVQGCRAVTDHRHTSYLPPGEPALDSVCGIR
jgi:hypothetical protein